MRSPRFSSCLLLCAFAAACLSLLLRAPLASDAYPTPPAPVLGCILPMTGQYGPQGLRVQTALQLMLSDINSGVAVGGAPANFAGVPLTLDFIDSKSTPIGGQQAVHEHVRRHGDNLQGIIGCINDEVTIPLDLVAGTYGLMVISPAAAAPSLAETVDHPLYARTVLSESIYASLWANSLQLIGWRRFALITAEDDNGKGYADLLLRACGNTMVFDPTTNTSSNPFEITSVQIPAQPSDQAAAVIGQALDQLLAAGIRIFLLHANKVNDLVLELAYARGMVGMGSDGIVRQWAGEFCTDDLAREFNAAGLGGALYGSICNVAPVPRTRNDRPINPAALAFEQRMLAANPQLFPPGWKLTHMEVAAANALIAWTLILGRTWTNPALANTGTAYKGQLASGRFAVEGVDNAVVYMTPEGDAIEQVDFVGWRGDHWEALGFYDLLKQTYNITGELLFATGTTAYPKDRPRIYIEGDALPVAWDGKFIVLAYVVVVLGAWTALILLEQTLSFWSRGQWQQALGWTLLASLAFGGCSVWPNHLMILTSLTLDVDAKLNIEQEFIAITFFQPFLLTMAAFAIALQSVPGGLKPAANVNVNEVSDVTGASRTGSRSAASASNSAARSHNGSTAAARTALRAVRAHMHKRWSRFRDGWIEALRLASWKLPLAALVLGVAQMTTLTTLQSGYYLKAHYSVGSGPQVGAWLMCAAIDYVCLLFYFHVTRSAWRYSSPFVLAVSTLAGFFLVQDSSSWTYAASVDISPWGLRGSLPADSTLAVIVALVSAGICLALMAFNVNRLRHSRNILDKVLAQVGGQVRALESDIEYEKELRQAVSEQGDFFRRSLELINLCRPIWRPYAIAWAMADPEEAALAAAAAVKGTEIKLPASGPDAAAQAAHQEKKNALRAKAAAASAKDGPSTGSAGGNADGTSKIPSDAKPLLVESSVASQGDAASSGAAVPQLPGNPMRASPAAASRKVSGAAKGAADVANKADSLKPPAGAAASSAAAAAPALGAQQSDFLRIHAPKKEKQLAALLKEIGDLHLDSSAPSSRVLADIKLPQLLSHPVTLELMKDVLAKNLSPENIALWLDIQRYRSLDTVSVRKAVADEIFQTFIVTGARNEVNLSSFMKLDIQQSIYKGACGLDLFDDVEREILRLMQTNNYDALAQSNMFKLAAIVLQHPAYKLKAATLANNVRGEIGGNAPSTIGQQPQQPGAVGAYQPQTPAGGWSASGPGSSPGTPMQRSVGLGGGVAGGAAVAGRTAPMQPRGSINPGTPRQGSVGRKE